MKQTRPRLLLCFAIGALLIQGCAATTPKSHDYSGYLAHMPRSILVLPPQNQSTEVMAPYIYLSTISRVLAEKGYYVYPVAVVDAMMKDNGAPTPEDMARIPLKKIKEIIGPDAVLYLTISEWGAKYQLVATTAVVHIRARLVDTATGTLLWEGEHSVVQDQASGSGGNLLQMMVAALVAKIVTNVSDPTREIAYRCNYELFDAPHDGLLFGEHNQAFAEEQRRRLRKTGSNN